VDTPVLEAHRHGIALVRPFLRALVLALAGAACFLAPWTAAAAVGAVLLALAAVMVGVARWDRTHLVVTAGALVVEHGVLRRSSASVSLNGTVFEVERPLLGRILGYGTVVAGELEIDCVPRRLTRALQQRR
jgi:uncharacterized membrane protein YdbT with pleckstrin-like domain